MGFNWDEYDNGGGGDFITAIEKNALKDTGAPFNIMGVSERPSRFEHEAEFVLRIVVPEGVEGVAPGDRVLTFPKGTNVGSRDAVLSGMVGYFKEPDSDEIPAKLVKEGKAWLIRPVQ